MAGKAKVQCRSFSAIARVRLELATAIVQALFILWLLRHWKRKVSECGTPLLSCLLNKSWNISAQTLKNLLRVVGRSSDKGFRHPTSMSGWQPQAISSLQAEALGSSTYCPWTIPSRCSHCKPCPLREQLNVLKRQIKVPRTITVLEMLDFICHPNSKANTQKSTYLI